MNCSLKSASGPSSGTAETSSDCGFHGTSRVAAAAGAGVGSGATSAASTTGSGSGAGAAAVGATTPSISAMFRRMPASYHDWTPDGAASVANLFADIEIIDVRGAVKALTEQAESERAMVALRLRGGDADSDAGR